jgi:hypothetical protein
MTQYKYVSVHEYVSGPKEGKRFLKFSKGGASGRDIQLPSPKNDVDTMAQMERERVMTWSLPEQMTKQECKEYLQDERPDVVWDELEKGQQDA